MCAWRPLGTHKLSNVSRHLRFFTFGSCTIRWEDPKNPTLEPNTTSIDKPVTKLWPFLDIQDGRQPHLGFLEFESFTITSIYAVPRKNGNKIMNESYRICASVLRILLKYWPQNSLKWWNALWVTFGTAGTSCRLHNTITPVDTFLFFIPFMRLLLNFLFLWCTCIRHLYAETETNLVLRSNLKHKTYMPL